MSFQQSGHKAIIGVDAGVTTGLAWGFFNPDLRDRTGLWTALARGRRTGWAEVGGGPDIRKNAILVATKVTDIIGDWNMGPWGIGVSDVLVVIEDFQAHGGAMGGTGRDKLAPVYVTGWLEGALTGAGWGPSVRMVMPSESKHLANDARLKALGAVTGGRRGWIKGKRHARDGWRLVAVGLEKTP
jgi:hypothetical protein